VNKVIEAKRADGVVGGSLDAAVTLCCDGELAEQLNALGDELRFVLITSGAVVGSGDGESTDIDGLSVIVEKASGEKCGRCWHYREDVGVHTEHEEICSRCIENVSGDGEVRHFA